MKIEEPWYGLEIQEFPDGVWKCRKTGLCFIPMTPPEQQAEV